MWNFLRPTLLRNYPSLISSIKQIKLSDGKMTIRMFKTANIKPKEGISKMKIVLLTTAAGISAGTIYSFYNTNQQWVALLNPSNDNSTPILKDLPDIKVTKQIRYPTDSSGLKLVLFQFATCPFCCKVRAFLDFHGISYDLVEVDSVFRQQLKWTDYKKVPIVLAKVGDQYIQLHDSSMIISALTSYLHDREVALEDVSNYYPSMSYVGDDGKVKKEVLNRYYIMFQKSIYSEEMNKNLIEERKWRQWADDVLVHMLSPNVYRNGEEALQAFKWFSEVGEWEKNFNSVETQFIVYIGALAMWMIGKRLKKRHQLKDDVRLSLYEEVNKWLKEIKKMGNGFHGGSSPDLADLAVYGVLNSIEGCTAFNDLIHNTKVKNWYLPMKDLISNNAGNVHSHS